MPLIKLKPSKIRNLQTPELELLEDGFNIIYGKNGSGKTSLLEAIYLLSSGRSFRTSDASQIMTHNEEALAIFGELKDQEKGVRPIGVARRIGSSSQAKLDGESAKFTDIARLFPVRMICPIASSELITGSPSRRREFLDWGVFHVKHTLWDVWRSYHKVLKQRNAALKARCPDAELDQWNQCFLEHCQALTALRKEYLEAYLGVFQSFIEKLPLFKELTVSYLQGWEAGAELLEVLKANRGKERMLGYSCYGAHRAELELKVGHHLAKEVLSRGQQKLLAIAMYLCQGALLKEALGRNPVYMIDDFASELDTDSQRLLMGVLEQESAQVIITTLDLDAVLNSISRPNKSRKIFNISQGLVQEVV